MWAGYLKGDLNYLLLEKAADQFLPELQRKYCEKVMEKKWHKRYGTKIAGVDVITFVMLNERVIQMMLVYELCAERTFMPRFTKIPSNGLNLSSWILINNFGGKNEFKK